MRAERKKVPQTETQDQAANGFAARESSRAQGEAGQAKRPVYYISIVAEMVETHPQTLRMYERMGLVSPNRTRNNVRLYSESDVEQVRRIQHLTQELGVNLAGVEVIFDLLREMQRLRAEMENASSEEEDNGQPPKKVDA